MRADTGGRLYSVPPLGGLEPLLVRSESGFCVLPPPSPSHSGEKASGDCCRKKRRSEGLSDSTAGDGSVDEGAGGRSAGREAEREEEGGHAFDDARASAGGGRRCVEVGVCGEGGVRGGADDWHIGVVGGVGWGVGFGVGSTTTTRGQGIFGSGSGGVEGRQTAGMAEVDGVSAEGARNAGAIGGKHSDVGVGRETLERVDGADFAGGNT